MERKLRDNIVSVHNACDRWTQVCQSAATHVKTIADSRTLLADPVASKQIDAYFDEDECRAKAMEEGVHLNNLIDTMKSLLKTINLCISSTNNLTPLLQGAMLAKLRSALFMMIEMKEMYDRNLMCWESTAVDLTVTYDCDMLLACLATAVHLPFINERIAQWNMKQLASLVE